MPTRPKPVTCPIRVGMVHYRDSAESGGSLRVGETIANHVDPARVAVEMVFAYGGPGPIAKQAKVPCHFVGARGPRDFPAWGRARGLFKKIQPDIVHFQDGVIWLRLALLGTPYKKALHVHGLYQKDRRNSNGGENPFRASALVRAALKASEAQICINKGARDSLLDLGWISHESSYVVYNSVDSARFQMKRDPAEARERLQLPKDRLLLGMVCRLVWEKGCADLLAIIERLPDRWHGVICGDGPLRQSLEQEARTRGIGERIHFLGVQDDIAPVYAALDAYAFLSRYEPFGLVLAEAMASGIPVFGIQGDGEYNEAEYPLLVSGTADLIPFEGSRQVKATLPDHILQDIASLLSNYETNPGIHFGRTERARSLVTHCFAAPLQAEAMTRVYEDICRISPTSPEQLSELYQAVRREAVTALVNTEETKREGVLA
jgi:glycosyltransferase involved in cell wall biosynthesis